VAVDAFPTVLGPARVARWACADQLTYQRACAEEERLVREIEWELSDQLGHKVRLTPPLVPEKPQREITEHEPETSEALPIGGLGEGYRPLQIAIIASMGSTGDSIFWHSEDVGGVSRITHFEKKSGGVGEFRHLLGHDPFAGLFLPVRFPSPFTLESSGDNVSIGSLMRLIEELDLVFREIFPRLGERGVDVPDWVIADAERFRLAAGMALEDNLALEIA